jgi:DNA-binding NarL/FixJ family response regulator
MAQESGLAAKRARIKVLVADRTPLTARLLANTLRPRGLVMEDTNESCILAAAATLEPDVILLSEHLAGTRARGIEVLKQLRTSVPQTRVILLLDSSERHLVVEAFRSGARGVFCRNDPVELLGKCVRRVYEGQLWLNGTQLGFLIDVLSDAIATRLVDAHGSALLSKREQDVVAWLSQGFTNGQIARELKLSENTIKNYLLRIFDKLGVSSRVEVVRYVAGRKAEFVHPEA